MERERKLELLHRQLGLKHKLKVHESMRPPEIHEEVALHLLAKWEFEDEIQAIEEVLQKVREDNVASKRSALLKSGPRSDPKKKAKGRG